MKNIIKLSIFATMFFLASCSDIGKDPVVALNGFKLNKDASVTSPSVLTLADETNTFGKFNWEISNNGPAAVSKYILVVFDHDNDPNLTNPIEYTGVGLDVTPEFRRATLTIKECNDLMNKLPTFKCSEMNIDFRIKSTLGANPETAFIQYSNPVTLAVTGYSIKQKILSFAKDGSNPVDAPKILSKLFTTVDDYQGYMYLEAGNYKFYQPDACGSFATPTIYGGTAGAIEEGASANSITITTAGHYLVKVDLTTGSQSYIVKNFKAFGVFGSATRAGAIGIANAVPMTYDSESNTWKITMDLIKGNKFKFKSNLWTGELITPSASAAFPRPAYVPPGIGTSIISTLGTTTVALALEDNNSNMAQVTVPGTFEANATQKYEIILDVSKPRNYTYKLILKN